MPYVPPSQISVKIVKTISYRGTTRQWSNRYYFNQTSLPSTTDQDTISAAIVATEKLQMGSRVGFVEAVWYAAGSDVPVRTTTLSGTGSMPYSGTAQTPGDCATLIRFSTTQRTSKNHPIYLFKYYHDAVYATGGDPDTVVTIQHSRNGDTGAILVTGITAGSTVYKLAGPHGAVAQGYVAEPLITHRDFPR